MMPHRAFGIAVGYIALYLLLDWVSFIHPLPAFDVTPWNPPPGVSLALLLVFGLRFLPLVLAPHPIDWSSENDYQGGLPGLKRVYHRGWAGLADRYNVRSLMVINSAIFLGIALVLTTVSRAILNRVLKILRRRGFNTRRILIVGNGPLAELVAD